MVTPSTERDLGGTKPKVPWDRPVKGLLRALERAGLGHTGACPQHRAGVDRDLDGVTQAPAQRGAEGRDRGASPRSCRSYFFVLLRGGGCLLSAQSTPPRQEESGGQEGTPCEAAGA